MGLKARITSWLFANSLAPSGPLPPPHVMRGEPPPPSDADLIVAAIDRNTAQGVRLEALLGIALCYAGKWAGQKDATGFSMSVRAAVRHEIKRIQKEKGENN